MTTSSRWRKRSSPRRLSASSGARTGRMPMSMARAGKSMTAISLASSPISHPTRRRGARSWSTTRHGSSGSGEAEPRHGHGPARRGSLGWSDNIPREGIMAEGSSLGALASRFVNVESLPWIDTGQGNKMKVLYHDPASDMLTILSKLEPGAGIPAHMHEDLEQTLVLEG